MPEDNGGLRSQFDTHIAKNVCGQITLWARIPAAPYAALRGPLRQGQPPSIEPEKLGRALLLQVL